MKSSSMQNQVVEGIVKRQRKNSILKELFRKTIHICSSFVPIFLYHYYWLTIILLCCALVLYLISECLRLKGISVPLIAKITETAARKRDENKFVMGPVTLVLGILIVSLLLPVKYATVGIFALAFGDGLASLVGRMIGKVTIPGSHGKTVAGSLTCFMAVYISSFCWCKNCFTSLILASLAMFIEMLPIADFDNIIIPIAIGSAYFLF